MKFFAAIAGYFHANGEPDEIEEAFRRTAAKMRAGYALLADTAAEGNRQVAAALGCRIVPPLEDVRLAEDQGGAKRLPAPKTRRKRAK